jgi:SagB-type dehydrogenase family enzyme
LLDSGPKKRPTPTKRKRAAPAALAAQLPGHVALRADQDGNVVAVFSRQAVRLGRFGTTALTRAQNLRTGLALDSFPPDRSEVDKEVDALVRRLARLGLLEFRLAPSPEADDQVVIEPQIADYWPRTPKLGDADTLVLSRFAYLRRRAGEMVLESPRAGALFRLHDPKIAAVLATLSMPQPIRKLRRQDGFPGLALLALLVDCDILLKTTDAADAGLRSAEGDDALVMWDFHDLLFHTRSTEGRHANPLGGRYPYVDVLPPLPAVRPRWPGKKIDLRKLSAAETETPSPFVRLLRDRHSVRSFDGQRPITLAELARFLDGAARVQSTWKSRPDLGDGGKSGPMISYAQRPYPGAGASWELELYLAVDACDGISRGFYHYDAGGHALVPITVRPPELDAALNSAAFATGATGAPQILVIIAARFGRVAWKYSSLAYELILKDVGILTQTLYLMATDLGLGGCAIGSANIDLFARMTGLDFHVEGAVGQFTLGRGDESETHD